MNFLILVLVLVLNFLNSQNNVLIVDGVAAVVEDKIILKKRPKSNGKHDGDSTKHKPK